MCITDALQQNIISFTKDGEDIARFLAETLRGETPGVKVNHRMEAAKHLIRYGFPDAECETTSDRLSRAGGNPERQGGDETPAKSPLSSGERARVRGKKIAAPVTHLDILNYQIAHLVRHETAEGHTIVNFLIHIMTGRDRPFTPRKFRIKPADRMAAARELLRRGFGDFSRRRRGLSDITDEANAYDTLHTDLARRMREYSERGADTIRFLLEVMSNPDPDEEFTIHYRVSAAQELLRRGWDTNYDAVKPEHLQAYWRDEDSPRLTIGQKKTLAGFTTSIDDYDNYDDTDYQAIAKEKKEEEDREAAVTKSLHPRYGKIRVCPELAEGTEVTEPVSKTLPLNESGGTATSKPPLPQGEGWGEGKETNAPSTLTLPKDAEAGDTPLALSLSKGTEEEKNLYDYGPSDPDPTVDYFYEPLSPEDQAKFDEEDRREYGIFEEESSENRTTNPTLRDVSNRLAHIKEAAAIYGTPVLPNPLARRVKKPTIRSP